MLAGLVSGQAQAVLVSARAQAPLVASLAERALAPRAIDTRRRVVINSAASWGCLRTKACKGAARERIVPPVNFLPATAERST